MSRSNGLLAGLFGSKTACITSYYLKKKVTAQKYGKLYLAMTEKAPWCADSKNITYMKGILRDLFEASRR